MAENRIDRELEKREKEKLYVKRLGRARDFTVSKSPSRLRISLDSCFKSRPSRCYQCLSKLREGWEPVKAADHPEISMVTIEQERFRDNVVIGGLLLCKAPLEMVDERNEYFQNQTDSQMSPLITT